jgi:putative ABC transport system permease protein
MYLSPGTSAAQAVSALRSAAQGRQALLIRSNADIRALSMRIFERTFVITRVLYWLAAGVAAVGLLSALLAWELERSRELALLRALGLTRARCSSPPRPRSWGWWRCSPRSPRVCSPRSC